MWIRVDDHFPDHPKCANLSPAAVALWLFAVCYCGEYETDGKVSHAVAVRLAARCDPQVGLLDGEPRIVAELVAAKLWDCTPNFYEVHHFLKYNPSHAELEKERRRKRRWARNARQTRVSATVYGRATRRAIDALVDGQKRRPDSTRSRSTTPTLSPVVGPEERKSEVLALKPGSNGNGSGRPPNEVARLVDAYRAIPNIVPTRRDGGVIASLLKQHGYQAVLKTLQREAAALAAAREPLLLLASMFRRAATRAGPRREGVTERQERYLREDQEREARQRDARGPDTGREPAG